MSKTLTARINLSFAKLAFSLFIMAILAGTLLVTPPAKATGRFSCSLGIIGTATRTVSCGSSAGNFVIGCTSNGCVDETGTNEFNQAIANQLCAQFEHDGCPDTLIGAPFPEMVESAQ